MMIHSNIKLGERCKLIADIKPCTITAGNW